MSKSFLSSLMLFAYVAGIRPHSPLVKKQLNNFGNLPASINTTAANGRLLGEFDTNLGTTDGIQLTNVHGHIVQYRNPCGQLVVGDGEFYNMTKPDGTGVYTLIITYLEAIINITIDASILTSSNPTLGAWRSLDGSEYDAASIRTIIGDAYDGRHEYGNSYGAMTQSIENNCDDGLADMDDFYTELVCNTSSSTNVDISAVQSIPVHNELRHLLATESERTVQSSLRQNIKYFGFLIAASAISGVVVGTVTNAVHPNNTNTQNLAAGFFPAGVVLLSGILSWASTRQLRNDVRVLVAAAAAAKLKDNTARVVKTATQVTKSAVTNRLTGRTTVGTVITQLAGGPIGGGEYCVDPNSISDLADVAPQLADDALRLANEATTLQLLQAAEEGLGGC